MIGEYLFQLTARDLQVTPLEIVNPYNFTVNGISSSFSTDVYTVPDGKILILLSAATIFQPSGVNQVVSGMLELLYPNGSRAGILSGTNLQGNTAAGLLKHWTYAIHEIFVPPLYTLRYWITLTGAGAGQQIDGSLNGILIPRGNVAL